LPKRNPGLELANAFSVHSRSFAKGSLGCVLGTSKLKLVLGTTGLVIALSIAAGPRCVLVDIAVQPVVYTLSCLGYLMKIEKNLNRPLRAALIWATLATGATYLYIFEPGKSGFFPGCPFRALTGFTCPGCGSTRGLHRLLHGDVIAAFEFNPLMILSLPVLFYALVRYTSAAWGDRPLKWNQPDVKYLWVLLAVVLSFWVFRNTPYYPFPS